MNSKPQLSFVIPLCNEEDGFKDLIDRLEAILAKSTYQIEVVLVNDGSSDNTAELMRAWSLTNPNYQSVFLSRNFGHQLAVSAGMKVAKATEAIMIIDGDLQDPPELIEDFYKKIKDEHFDVVYGVRRMRKDEGAFKRYTSSSFYKVLHKLSNTSIPANSGDFCMVTRQVLDVMNQMPEDGRFLRGMRAWVGFKQTDFPFERNERTAGETKYTLKKMINLALNAIFGFSDLPIKVMIRLGLITILIAFGYLIFSIAKKYIWGIDVESGFNGLLFTITLFSGVQLFSLGIIGEYVVRTFFQVKQRPLFIIAERIENGEIVNA